MLYVFRWNELLSFSAIFLSTAILSALYSNPPGSVPSTPSPVLSHPLLSPHPTPWQVSIIFHHFNDLTTLSLSPCSWDPIPYRAVKIPLRKIENTSLHTTLQWLLSSSLHQPTGVCNVWTCPPASEAPLPTSSFPIPHSQPPLTCEHARFLMNSDRTFVLFVLLDWGPPWLDHFRASSFSYFGSQVKDHVPGEPHPDLSVWCCSNITQGPCLHSLCVSWFTVSLIY